MQPNKKYVASDGYEYFMCPMTQFTITQVENVGTHKGTKAVDFASGTVGYRAPYYAPATVRCVKTIPSYGEATWQTVNKVHCPNGYFGIVTFETVHDEGFNAYVGMTILQGVQLGNMGKKPSPPCTGVHVHMEFTQSANSSMGYNGYGVYTFRAAESYVDDTFYVNDTKILNGGKGNWRKCNVSAPAPAPKPQQSTNGLIQEDGIATLTVDAVRARRGSATGEVVRSYNTGDKVRYYWKWVGNGHRYVVWKEGNDYIYLAVSGSEERGKDSWATFTAPDEPKPQPKPEPKPEPQPEPKPEFSDKPTDSNFLENPNAPVEVFKPKSKLFEKYGIKLVNNIVPKNMMPYKCPFVITKAFTVTHNAGTNGNPSAEQLSHSMANTKEEKSWHFSVDETTIVQNLPLNRNCWACGDYGSGWGSKNGINLEICRDMDGANSDKFSIAERNGAILVAELMYQNGWTKETIKKHQDFMNKYCPHKTLDLGWDRYVQMVMDLLDEANGIVKPTPQPEQKPEEPQKPVEPEKPSIDEENKGLINTLLKLLIDFFKRLLGK